MPYRILIVGSRQALPARPAGGSSEFESATCSLGAEALKRLGPGEADLIVVDEEPQDMSCATFLQILRQTEAGRKIPVMVLSSNKSEDALLAAFELGAQDYLEKPCDPREFAARARAVLRRRSERSEERGAVLSVGGVEIDPSQRRCEVAGKRVSLQPREFELLEILMRREGRVLGRAYLLETVWGMASDADTRAVDVVVSRLRGKLGARAARMVETVSKLGYCFRGDLGRALRRG